MNVDILILFMNAFLTTALSIGIVIWILRTQYLPTIRKEEKKLRDSGKADGSR